MHPNPAPLQFVKGSASVNHELFQALEALELERVRDALRQGADVNLHMGALAMTPLMYCARNCAFDPAKDLYTQRQAQLDILKLVLERGAKVNAVNRKGNSALHYALATEFDEAAQALMRAGASLNSINHKGIKAMDLCNSTGTPGAFDYMMREILRIDDMMWDDLIDQM